MKNNKQLKTGLPFLSILLLTACNGGNSSSNTTTQPNNNPLANYVKLLHYTPATPDLNSAQLNSLSFGNQQSFYVSTEKTITSIDINYFPNTYYDITSGYCIGNPILATTLTGPVTVQAGTYTSSDASNYALCSMYDDTDGCLALYTALSTNNAPPNAVQYTYHLNDGSS